MFQGPLFIVGMPRSGTKLLRTLLDQHPLIGITQFETEFFPYWVRNWSKFGKLSEYDNFQKFYMKMLKVPYFLYCSRSGSLIKCETWYHLCEDYTPARVFEALLRHDVMAPAGSKKIWGDKSPGYLKYMRLLKQHFPEAKFVHIVRDVRDYCLSINKAWGKNMIRAAQRWVDTISWARHDARQFRQDYFELRYEDLLQKPARTLGDLCCFLGIPFEERMLALKRPTENIGDARGKRGILSGNKSKFLTRMDPGTIGKIEKISWHVLKDLNYPVSTYPKVERLPRYKMQLYRLLDALNLIITNLRRHGPIYTYKFVRGFIEIS